MSISTRIMSKLGPLNLALGYTQIPNDFIDRADDMTDAELRAMLQIIRKTNGWHKEKDRISLSQLELKTGMSRPAVINGLNKSLERGILSREASGQNYIYSLNTTCQQENLNTELEQASSRGLPVNEGNQLARITSTGSRGLPEVVIAVNTQKKLIKETNKERIPAIADTSILAPSNPNPSTNTILNGNVFDTNIIEDIIPAARYAELTLSASENNTNQSMQTVVTKTTMVEQRTTMEQITTSSANSTKVANIQASLIEIAPAIPAPPVVEVASPAKAAKQDKPVTTASQPKSPELQKVISHYESLWGPKRGKGVKNEWLEYWLVQADQKRLLVAITIAFEKQTNSAAYIGGVIERLEDNQLSQFDSGGHRIKLEANASSTTNSRRWEGGSSKSQTSTMLGNNLNSVLVDEARVAAIQRSREMAELWGVKSVGGSG